MAPLSEEEENYVRLALLLTGMAHRAVRTLFDRELSPTHLPSILNKNYNILDFLKSKRIVNQAQWNLLFPRNGVPDSKTFDVTLMFCLIRNFTSVIPPTKGFDSLPLSQETTLGPDLARIKYYRNKLAHHDRNTIDTAFFNSAWRDISDAIGRLGGQTMYHECQELKVKILDQPESVEIKQLLEEMKDLRLRMTNLEQEHLRVTVNVGELQESYTFKTEYPKSIGAGYTKVTHVMEEFIPWNIRIIKYDTGAFPRLNLLQTRLQDFKKLSECSSSESLQSPCIRFVCNEMIASNLKDNNYQFSVNGSIGECIERLEDNTDCLVVTVCFIEVIQTDEPGKIMLKDGKLLMVLNRIVPEEHLNNVIFVIPASKPGLNLQICSEEISKSLKLSQSVNTIFHRLFAIPSSEISKRISLLFEKNLLDQFPKLGKLDENLEIELEKKKSDRSFETILTNGPLAVKTCQEFLQCKAMEHERHSVWAWKQPWNKSNLINRIKDNLCKSLSAKITLTLSNYLTNDGVDNSTDVDLQDDKITVTIPECVILKDIEKMMALQIEHFPYIGIQTVLSFPDESSFIHSIADTFLECIMVRSPYIILTACQMFTEVYLQYIRMHKILNVFKRRNQLDTNFQEIKTITERNSQIKACGLFGNTINIYILKKADDEASIRSYLCKYKAKNSNVNICDYQEMSIKKHSFKSGSKMKLEPNHQARYGTVCFPLIDAENRYYCATCKHVTLQCTNLVYVQTDDGTELPATLFYSNDDCDFSLVRLQNTTHAFSKGIRNDDNCFISGDILQNDMTPVDDSTVYKWGATTDLTSGKYKGLLCTRKGFIGKYDLETYIIDGGSEQFSRGGDSGSLICIKPDSVIYTRHMAAFILTGEIEKYDDTYIQNRHACYRVVVPLSEMKKTHLCKAIDPCFSF